MLQEWEKPVEKYHAGPFLPVLPIAIVPIRSVRASQRDNLVPSRATRAHSYPNGGVDHDHRST